MSSHKILQLCAVDFTVKHLLLPLIDRLQEEGFVVRTVCSAGPDTAELINRGYDIHNIEIVRKISPLALARATFRLYCYMKREKFDIVHVHTPVASIVGRIAAKVAGVPLIIYTAHGFYFHEGMPVWKQRLFVFMEKMMGRFFTDVIFTQSHEDFEVALSEGIAKPGGIFHIGNGVNLARFEFGDQDEISKAKRRELGISPTAKIVGFVGRIVKEKGIIDLITAFSRVAIEHPDAQLLIIGDNMASERDITTKETVFRLVDELGLQDRVIFTGRRDDVNELLTTVDIFVLPSYREGMPRSIIEAMAAGKPVIATDIRGCREEVVADKTGFLVPAANPVILGDHIAKLLDDPVFARGMGVKARVRAQDFFDERVVLTKQITVIRELLA